MAQRDLDLALRIRADLAQARREIAGLREDLRGMGSGGKQAGNDLRGMNRELAESERRAQGTAEAVRQLERGLKALGVAVAIRAVVSATIRQEQAVAQLDAALRSTGGAIGYTRDQLMQMASELQALTGIGDEAIIEAQTRLVAYTGIIGSQFPRALALVLDQSTRLNMSLEQSAETVGRALESPLKAAEALSRQGFTAAFTEEVKAQIKALVEAGRVADAQAIILGILEDAYGGAAVAARDTFGGALSALKTAVGDLLEAKGGLPEAKEQINALVDVVSDPRTVDGFDKITSAIVRLTGVAAEAIVELAVLGETIGAFAAFVAGNLDPLDDLELQIRDIDRALKNSWVGVPSKFWFTSREELERLRDQLVAERDALLAARGLSAPTGAISAPAPTPTPTPSAPLGPSEDFLKAQADLERRIALLGRVTAAQQMLWEVEKGRYKDLAQNEKDALLALARRLDAGEAERRAGEEAERRAAEAKNYVEQLERQAATLSMNAAQVRAWELAEKGLRGALLARAQAAQAAIAADEQRRQADANARTNTSLEAEYLRAIGRTADAAVVEMNARFAQMRREMIESGNQAGLAWIERLIPVNQARIRLDEVQREIDNAFSAQARREQSIDAQVNAGLITQIEGRRQLVELHRETAALVERYLPALREMAALPGPMGEQARAALETLETQLIRLRTTTDELRNALRDGLQTGIAGALEGLATGTRSVEDAVRSLVLSVAQALAQLAAQRLAEPLTDQIMGLFGAAGESSAVAVAGAVAATEMAAGVTAGGAAAAGAMTSGVTAGGTAAGAAMASSITSAGAIAAQAIGAAMASASAARTALGLGFATGGHVRGPGTGTSDSIPAWLSDDEFVTRASVVRQPGALPFLRDFNARGMAALNDWARRVRHATGGLAGIPAPSFPAPQSSLAPMAEPARMMAPTLNNRFRFVNLFDRDALARLVASSPVFERSVVNTVGDNPSAVQQRWSR